jgi:hypothetical protein
MSVVIGSSPMPVAECTFRAVEAATEISPKFLDHGRPILPLMLMLLFGGSMKLLRGLSVASGGVGVPNCHLHHATWGYSWASGRRVRCGRAHRCRV